MADLDGAAGLDVLGFADHSDSEDYSDADGRLHSDDRLDSDERLEPPQPRSNRGRLRLGVGLSVGLSLLALVGWEFLVVTRPPAKADAAPSRLVQLASARAAAQPDLVPDPSQFWYVHDGSYQAWLSIDGQHDGLVITDGRRVPMPACVLGQQAPNGNSRVPIACVPDPAYLADAPTDAGAMRAYVDQRAGGSSGPNGVAKEMLDLLEMHYLQPAARAAVFDAAASMTGLTPVKAGTHGLSAKQVAVSVGDPTSSVELIFDADSHGFIGVITTSALGAGASLPSFGLVDQVGQTV